jgi:hypothetical protein
VLFEKLMFCSESINMGPRRVRADRLKTSLRSR